MKKLNVKWLPETFAVVSLRPAPACEIYAVALDAYKTRLQTGAPGKLIIISDGRELRANVATLQ